MLVWVLFIWSGVITDLPVAAYTFHTKAECLEFREPYRRAQCAQVIVQHPKRTP
jgi:hypothetical protein